MEKTDVAQAIVENWDLDTLINYAIDQLVAAYELDPELLESDIEFLEEQK